MALVLINHNARFVKFIKAMQIANQTVIIPVGKGAESRKELRQVKTGLVVARWRGRLDSGLREMYVDQECWHFIENVIDTHIKGKPNKNRRAGMFE